MYVLVVAISGGDVVATSVVAKSAPSFQLDLIFPQTKERLNNAARFPVGWQTRI